MKAVDRVLQQWRIRKVLPWIKRCRRVIDVGAHKGELFEAMKHLLIEGFGVEPLAPNVVARASYRIHPGLFPEVCPETLGQWDAITMLAVLEHIPRDRQGPLAEACARLLRPGGRVVVTVPGATVDRILGALKFLRLIDGMSLEEHYGFEANDTRLIFCEPSFKLLKHSAFQLGLNNLFVFERTGEAMDGVAGNEWRVTSDADEDRAQRSET